MRILSILLLILPLAQMVSAQTSSKRQTAQALIEGWNDWMNENEITLGAIAISDRSTLIAEDGIGRTAGDAAPVASLSKAITGVCALKALEETGNTHSLKLENALPTFFSRYRVKDKRVFAITVGQLISHDSGIQSNFEKRYTKFKTFEEAQTETQMRMIVLERLGSNPGRSNYHYSNANYLTLGLVIEELTGEPYEAYCKREVLEPLGILSASLSKRWAIMFAYGGWEISAKDYLTFLNAHFSDGLIMGQTPTRFAPKVHIGNNRYYGPGVLFRKTDKGALVWHAGAWKWRDENINDAFGAFFLMLDDGLAISTNFNSDASNGALEQLEKIFWEITHP